MTGSGVIHHFVGAAGYASLTRPAFSDAAAAIAVTVNERAVARIKGRRAGAGRARDVARRGRRRRSAIGRIDQDIGAVGTRQVAAVLIVVIAARPRVALRGNSGASGRTKHRADRSTTTAAERAA